MDLSERIQRAKKLLFSWPFAEFLVVAALSVGLGHVLEDVEALMPLRNAGYQTFFNGFRAPRMPQRVGIVTIDDDLVYPANPYRQRRLAASLRPVIEKLAADKHVVVLDIRLFVDDSDIGTCDALQECKPRPTSAKDLEDLLVFASAAFGGGSACRLVVPALLVQNTDGSVKNSPTEVSEIIRRKDLKNICFGYTSLLPDNRMIPWRVGTKAGGFVDSLAFRAAMALDPSTPALRAQFSNPPTATFWKPELFPTLPASKGDRRRKVRRLWSSHHHRRQLAHRDQRRWKPERRASRHPRRPHPWLPSPRQLHRQYSLGSFPVRHARLLDQALIRDPRLGRARQRHP